MRLLVLGCGSIGAAVARAADAMADVEEVVCVDAAPGVAERLAASLSKGRASSLAAGLPGCDVVLEAASQAVVAAEGERVLAAGKDLVVLSVGALADDALRARLVAAARASGRRVHVPSGALGGLDAVRAAGEAPMGEVVLTTSKPPSGLGVADEGKPVVLFDGPAREAVVRFPKNVNVAATLALAGVGFDRTRVRVVADPSLARNRHELRATGEAGTVSVVVENVPFPDNPRTSFLAALSAIQLVRRLASPIQVG